MPTPDPSFLPAQLAAVGGAWQDYAPTLLTAVVALIALVTIPVIAIKGGFRWVLRGLRTVFRVG